MFGDSAYADYSVSIVHYKCSPEEHKVEIWHEGLVNEEGTLFDKPLEGAYDPNTLVERNKDFYRESRPSKKSPITKICKFGHYNEYKVYTAYEIKVEIHLAGLCQDGALVSVTVYSNNKTIYKTPTFGGSCSTPADVGPETVEKITITPRNVELKSRFWYW